MDGEDDFNSSRFYKVSLGSCPVLGGWSFWCPEKQKAGVSWVMEDDVLSSAAVKDQVILALV